MNDIRYILYLKKLSNKMKINIHMAFLSLIIYLFWYYMGFDNSFTSRNLHIFLGHIGYMFLLIIPAFLVIENNFLQKWWVFFTTLTILDLVNLFYITNNEKFNPINEFILILCILLLIYTFLMSISKSVTSIDFITKTKDLWIVFSSSLIFMFIYHASNYYLKVVQHVANEDRSVFINGLEFHHINYGIVLLVFVPFFFKYISRLPAKLVTLGYVFIGFIYGTVFDEAYYYMLKDVSDEAYLYPSVIIIQVLMMLFSFGLWFYLLKNKKVLNA